MFSHWNVAGNSRFGLFISSPSKFNFASKQNIQYTVAIVAEEACGKVTDGNGHLNFL